MATVVPPAAVVTPPPPRWQRILNWVLWALTGLFAVIVLLVLLFWAVPRVINLAGQIIGVIANATAISPDHKLTVSVANQQAEDKAEGFVFSQLRLRGLIGSHKVILHGSGTNGSTAGINWISIAQYGEEFIYRSTLTDSKVQGIPSARDTVEVEFTFDLSSFVKDTGAPCDPPNWRSCKTVDLSAKNLATNNHVAGADIYGPKSILATLGF